MEDNHFSRKVMLYWQFMCKYLNFALWPVSIARPLGICTELGFGLRIVGLSLLEPESSPLDDLLSPAKTLTDSASVQKGDRLL